jgi:hypothetical protein
MSARDTNHRKGRQRARGGVAGCYQSNLSTCQAETLWRDPQTPFQGLPLNSIEFASMIGGVLVALLLCHLAIGGRLDCDS